jgi:hypothetical protein
MSFKAYFDGSGKSDNLKQKYLTLAAFSGSGVQWDHFTEHWDKNLKLHAADFLHTTDAVNRKGEFKDWQEDQVDALIDDCVTIIERCVTVKDGDNFTFRGLRPIATSVNLEEFRKALLKQPDIGTPEHLCVIYDLAYVHTWANFTGYHKLQLFFDQNEPFMGYVVDRKSSKRVIRDAPGMKEIVHVGESDMRHVPALQATDLLGWCVNRKCENGNISKPWIRRMLAIDRDGKAFRYADMLDVKPENIAKVKTWKMPKRRFR